MSVWNRYSEEQKREYIHYLQMYGALSNLFRQKKGALIPLLNYKFQETVYAKAFDSKIVDLGNTPHDVLSIFGEDRIGIGIKTWMKSTPSFQKVMQLKRNQKEINVFRNDPEALAFKVSEIKNKILKQDYARLDLDENKNIYHYVTRNEDHFIVNECAYPLVDLNNLKDIKPKDNAIVWSDGNKDYKYTYGDSQIHQKFDASKNDSLILNQFDVKIIEDPFTFLMEAFQNLIDSSITTKSEFIEVYLPLYSYSSQEVEEKSGLNAWNAAPKNKGSNSPRPLNEVYIPIPIKFHKKHPDFFTNDIIAFDEKRKSYIGAKQNKPEVRFNLQLPNGKIIPSLVTQSNMKGLQSGSNTQKDENGKFYGQGALGQWLLVDVLGLKKRKKVTREWLSKRGTDSVRLWRKKDDYKTINIDFAPVGSFEAFMNDEPLMFDE